MNCTAGLHWNMEENKCDEPSIAKCTVTNTFPDTFPICERRNGVTFYPHPEKCNWFLYCYHGHMTVQQCQYYYNWDVEEKRCLKRTIAKCLNGTDTGY